MIRKLRTIIGAVCIVVGVLYCDGVAFAQPVWEQVSTLEAAYSGFAMCFTTPERGYLDHTHGQHRLYMTDDGGTTWSDTLSGPGNLYVTEITFFSPRQGFVCADRFCALTFDSGATWETISLPAPRWISCVAYLSPSRLVGCGDYRYSDYSGVRGIYLSTDSGRTWTTQVWDSCDWNCIFHRVCVSGSGTVLVGSMPYGIRRSTDAGMTWSTVPDFPLNLPSAMASPAPGKFWAAGLLDTSLANPGYPALASSSDDGQTWQLVWSVPDSVDGFLSSIAFGDSLNGWAGGSHGWLLHTTDGGETWTESHLAGVEFGLMSMSLLDANTGWAADPGLTAAHIYRLRNGDSGGSGNHRAYMPTDGTLSAHPNPFNAQTTITVTLNRAQHARLRVYDLQGRYVDELCNDRLPAGQSRFTYSATALASGLYFLELRTSELRCMQKIILLR